MGQWDHKKSGLYNQRYSMGTTSTMIKYWFIHKQQENNSPFSSSALVFEVLAVWLIETLAAEWVW